MKLLIIVLALFTASFASAELKPDGALVPTMCGDNNLESVLGGPDYPMEVCTFLVIGGDGSNSVIGIKTPSGMTYYVITAMNAIPGSSNMKWALSEALVTEQNGNVFLNGWVKTTSMEVTSYTDTNGTPSLSGALFDVQLEIVFTTM